MKTFLERRGFRRLLVGQTVSALGDWMATFALMELARRYSGSSTAVGAVLVLRLLPGIVGGSAVARIVARWDRRSAMLLMDLTRAAIVLAIPFVRELWWVYLWAFVLEVCGLAFLPARDASVPDLVEPEYLSTANGLVMASSFGTIPFGAGAFAVAGALSPEGGWGARLPFLAVFVFDALTYLVSYVAIRGCTGLAETVEREAAAGRDERRRFRDAFAIPLVRVVLPATLIIALGLGALFSLGIVLVREVLHATDAEFGVLIVLFGAGAAAGLGVLSRFRSTSHLAAVRGGAFAQGVTVAVMSLAPSLALTFLGAVAFGAATAVSLASGISALQDGLDGDDRVLAFAAFHVVIRAVLALAAVGAGIAADVLHDTRLPGLGSTEPARVVLLGAGVVVMFGSGLLRRLEVARA